MSVPGAPSIHAPLALVQNGWLGVDIFFALSGYLISLQLLREISAQRLSLRNFYARRILRTFPAYLACLLALYALAPVLNPYGIQKPGALDLLTHLLFLQDYSGRLILPTFWSIATEEKFYVLAPLVVIATFSAASNFQSRMLLLLLATVWAIAATRAGAHAELQPETYGEYFFALRAPFHLTCDGLIVGCVGALATHVTTDRPARPMTQRTVAIVAATGLGAVLLAPNWASDPRSATLPWVGLMTASLAGALIWAHPAADAVLARLPGKTVIQSLALTSYSIYLTHYVAALLAAGWSFSNGSPLPFWTTYAVLTGLFSVALYRLVEKPGMDMRKWLLANGRTGR